MQTLVRDILERKGNKFIAVEADTTAAEAIRVMTQQKVGAVFVVREEELIGVFTERDFVHRVAIEERPAAETRLEDVMTRAIFYVTPTTSVLQCMALMTEKRCRHLPVLENGVQRGVVSIGDCVKQLSADASAQVAVLTDYIINRYPG